MLHNLLNHHNLSIVALAPKEESRLTGILCTPDYTAVTDGHILMKVETPAMTSADFPVPRGACLITGAEGENAEDCTTHDHQPGCTFASDAKNFIIPSDVALSVAAKMPTRETIPVLNCAAICGPVGNREIITNDLETVRRFPVTPMTGNYPDIDRVIPRKQDADFVITLDAALLLALAKQITAMARDKKRKNDKRPAAVTLYLRKPGGQETGKPRHNGVLMESTTTEGQAVTTVIMPLVSTDSDDFWMKTWEDEREVAVNTRTTSSAGRSS